MLVEHLIVMIACWQHLVYQHLLCFVLMMQLIGHENIIDSLIVSSRALRIGQMKQHFVCLKHLLELMILIAYQHLPLKIDC